MNAKNIHQKLADIQSVLFVPKGKRNEFGNFSYRSCEDILKVLKPLLAEHKCTLTMSNSTVQIGESNYVNVTVTLYDLESDAKIEVTGQAREPFQKKGMDDMQITGAASSYARKYALAGLFAIDNEQDSDAKDNRTYTPSHPVNPKKLPKGVQVWTAYKKAAEETGEVDDATIKATFAKLVADVTGKTSSKDVTDAEWDRVLERFTA